MVIACDNICEAPGQGLAHSECAEVTGVVILIPTGQPVQWGEQLIALSAVNLAVCAQ